MTDHTRTAIALYLADVRSSDPRVTQAALVELAREEFALTPDEAQEVQHELHANRNADTTD